MPELSGGGLPAGVVLSGTFSVSVVEGGVEGVMVVVDVELGTALALLVLASFLVGLFVVLLAPIS